jgi:gamma-glutamylcyclotransferase (GGCT)/AIG2-like uncharacterized protein YtfP
VASFIRFFVYGTLKPGESNYDRYCGDRVVQSCEAVAYGQLFDLAFGYPAMTEGGSPVYGYLLTFAESDILKELDELEDYDAERSPEQNEYQRREIEVFDLRRQSLGQAWTYVMAIAQVEALGGIWLPNGVWVGKHRPANRH